MSLFKFKQFDVDQTGCAMKVNTDGVLLGALAEAYEPKSIADIGTGTGVVALMLAQRFPNTKIDAIEVDEDAARIAADNFSNSKFSDRLTAHFSSFMDFFEAHNEAKYDLIVSNPPFYLHSLTSANNKKNLAKHTDVLFFERLINCIAAHLTDTGTCQLIVPLATSAVVNDLLPKNQLQMQKIISLKSFTDSIPYRQIITFGKQQKDIIEEQFVIYDTPKVYAMAYKVALKDFLTIF